MQATSLTRLVAVLVASIAVAPPFAAASSASNTIFDKLVNPAYVYNFHVICNNLGGMFRDKPYLPNPGAYYEVICVK